MAVSFGWHPFGKRRIPRFAGGPAQSLRRAHTTAIAVVRTQETREAALIRLARKAREEGVELYQDRHDGRYYASSASTPGTLYYVTGFSCDCKGFVQHGRCKHYAALMSALGWIVAPEPEPSAPAAGPTVCGYCNGLGETQYTRGAGRGRSAYDWQTCSACHGAGTELTEILEAA